MCTAKAPRGPSAPAEARCREAYRDVGQPVLIPGSMGTSSYVLCGSDSALDLTFGSACHGAGRVMSRSQAIKTVHRQEM